MNISLTQPTVTLTLSIDEAHALFVDLEDVYESQSGPGLTRTTERIMGELGATLEDGGYLPDDPDDTPPAGHNVINLFIDEARNLDPSVTDWQSAFLTSHLRGVRRAV